MIILIDNYDSFTYNLLDYLRQFQPDTYLIRNDELSMAEIESMKPGAFVFSPGPQQPRDHPLMYRILEQYHQSTPILGICLGFQAIAEFFGGQIQKGPEPVHGKTSKIRHFGHSAFKGIPEVFQVTRYHSLVLKGADAIEGIEVTAVAEEGGIPMALVHRQWPVWGFQFHPEAILTEYGLDMIRNWLRFYHLLPEDISGNIARGGGKSKP